MVKPLNHPFIYLIFLEKQFLIFSYLIIKKSRWGKLIFLKILDL